MGQASVREAGEMRTSRTVKYSEGTGLRFCYRAERGVQVYVVTTTHKYKLLGSHYAVHVAQQTIENYTFRGPLKKKPDRLVLFRIRIWRD